VGRHSEAPPADRPAPEPEVSAIHNWRVMRLSALGLSWSIADAVADIVDWHDVAKLVDQGCPASLAVTILT
jgi:hypothetical protein